MSLNSVEKNALSFNSPEGQTVKGQVVVEVGVLDPRQVTVIRAEIGQSYKIINAVTKQVVKPQKVEREGKRLRITLDDGETLEVMEFFDGRQAQQAEFVLSTNDSSCPIVIIESAL